MHNIYLVYKLYQLILPSQKVKTPIYNNAKVTEKCIFYGVRCNIQEETTKKCIFDKFDKKIKREEKATPYLKMGRGY